eukprot:gene3288-5217_t
MPLHICFEGASLSESCGLQNARMYVVVYPNVCVRARGLVWLFRTCGPRVLTIHSALGAIDAQMKAMAP